MKSSLPLDHPATVRKLWKAFAVMLGVTLLIQVVLPVEPHFGIDGWFGFAAIFGFLACGAMVVVAKLLGYLLKRPEGYYREGGKNP